MLIKFLIWLTKKMEAKIKSMKEETRKEEEEFEREIQPLYQKQMKDDLWSKR